jgi:hypothetical protein
MMEKEQLVEELAADGWDIFEIGGAEHVPMPEYEAATQRDTVLPVYITMDVLRDCMIHGRVLQAGEVVVLEYLDPDFLWRWYSDHSAPDEDADLLRSWHRFRAADVEAAFRLLWVEQRKKEEETMSNKERALELCRGVFQRGLVLGYETLGSKTRRGRALRYEKQYRNSAWRLIERLRAAAVPHHIMWGPRGGWYSARLVIDD